MVSLHSSLIVIGGICNYYVSRIVAKYTIDNWEHIGDLRVPRDSHRAITIDDRIYNVGNWGDPL